MEGGKLILVLKITVNKLIWSCEIKISFKESCEIKISSSLKLFSSMLSYMVMKYGGATFLENLGVIWSKSRSGL